jgi:hypothetical protein
VEFVHANVVQLGASGGEYCATSSVLPWRTIAKKKTKVASPTKKPVRKAIMIIPYQLSTAITTCPVAAKLHPTGGQITIVNCCCSNGQLLQEIALTLTLLRLVTPLRSDMESYQDLREVFW